MSFDFSGLQRSMQAWVDNVGTAAAEQRVAWLAGAKDRRLRKHLAWIVEQVVTEPRRRGPTRGAPRGRRLKKRAPLPAWRRQVRNARRRNKYRRSTGPWPRNFDPNQPRVPFGRASSGEWTPSHESQMALRGLLEVRQLF